MRHGLELLSDGADLLDVGGESTRPGAERVPAQEELRASLYAFDLVQRRAKRPAGAPDTGLARPVTSIGVVGAGLMAGQLALLFARRLQVQERLTTQVAQWLTQTLEPKGVGVILEAEHLCMSLRGVQKPGARTVTSAVRGILKSSAVTRAEAMSLILGR